jgi:hypothetical protein
MKLESSFQIFKPSFRKRERLFHSNEVVSRNIWHKTQEKTQDDRLICTVSMNCRFIKYFWDYFSAYFDDLFSLRLYYFLHKIINKRKGRITRLGTD